MVARVENLIKYYGNTKAVDDISFTFSEGQICGFVGPNGAGKTTTIRVLATLLEPSSGDAYVKDVSVVQEPEKARKHIGYMPDTLPSHSDITVHEYLDFYARAYGVHPNRRRKVIEGIEEFTNLMGIKGKFLKALSKGMKQRVSLARSLVHDPAILILDEPAAGLDPRARIELRELLKVLADQGKAILISSHILTELAEICNGAVIIEHGKLLRAGTIEELKRQNIQKHSILVRALDDMDGLFKELLQCPHVEEVRWVGKSIEFDTHSSPEIHHQVLNHIVNKGFKIIEYSHQHADLEDIFMSLTKGVVQ